MVSGKEFNNMKDLKDLREEKISVERNRYEHIIILIVLALLIRLLTGLFSHDHLAWFNPKHPAWKSWYIHMLEFVVLLIITYIPQISLWLHHAS